MKTSDWAWNGRGRRHGEWFVGKPSGWFHLATYNAAPRWLLKIGALWLAWFPNDRPRLAVNLWRWRR